MDVASSDSPLHLRMVLSPGTTPAARLLLPRRLRQLPEEQRLAARALEVCPQGMALAEGLAQRVQRHGGAALIIDYGQVRQGGMSCFLLAGGDVENGELCRYLSQGHPIAAHLPPLTSPLASTHPPTQAGWALRGLAAGHPPPPVCWPAGAAWQR